VETIGRYLFVRYESGSRFDVRNILLRGNKTMAKKPAAPKPAAKPATAKAAAAPAKAAPKAKKGK
jgi:hypothetical protein